MVTYLMDTGYVSVAEAAQILGITRQAVLKRIGTGRLEAAKVGRNYVIPAAAVRPAAEAPDPILTEIVDRLVASYGPERIYLFGSAARGDRTPGSDYDLLLVVPDDAPEELLRARRAYEVLWGVGASVDVIVWRRSSFDARSHVTTSLPATVLAEGRLLHAA